MCNVFRETKLLLLTQFLLFKPYPPRFDLKRQIRLKPLQTLSNKIQIKLTYHKKQETQSTKPLFGKTIHQTAKE